MKTSSRYCLPVICAVLATSLAEIKAHAFYPWASVTYNYEHPTYMGSTVSDCDDCGEVVDLPFVFPFYGEQFTQITVSSNGYILMGNNIAEATQATDKDFVLGQGGDANPEVPERIIAPLWADWNPQLGGDVYYGSMASGAFVIEWNNVVHDGDMANGTYTFELKLYPSGKFEFHYVKMSGASNACCQCLTAYDCGYSATSGYKHLDDTVGQLTHWPKDSRSLSPVYGGNAIAKVPSPNAIYWKVTDEYFDRNYNVVPTRVTWYCKTDGNAALKEYNTDLVGSDGIVRSVSSGVGWLLTRPNCRLDPGWYPLSYPTYVQLASLYDRSAYPGPYAMLQMGQKDKPSGNTFRFVRALSTPRPERTVEWRVYDQSRACSVDTDCPPGDDPRAAAASDAKPEDLSRDANLDGKPDNPNGYYGRCNQTSLRCEYPSKRDWFRGSDTKKDKVVLVVPGIDALNNDTSAHYYYLLNTNKIIGLAGRLLTQGYDIVIGDYGDGHRSLDNLTDEVANWIQSVGAETDTDPATYFFRHKIQVAGVSQGGVLVRHALGKYTAAKDVTKAWYSVDSPQKGANIGSGWRGIGTLVNCNLPNSKADLYLNSRPARQLAFEHGVDCACGDNEPEDWYCRSFSDEHNAFYDQVKSSFPDTIPHYAVAFGNAQKGAVGYRLPASFRPDGKMYSWYYSGACTVDQDWYSGKRDCLPGSSYLVPELVNDSSGWADAWWNSWTTCGSVSVKLTYSPAFMPIHSALDWQVDEQQLLGACDPDDSTLSSYYCLDSLGNVIGVCRNQSGSTSCWDWNNEYLSIDPGNCYTDQLGYRFHVDPSSRWTEWAGNADNWPHCVLTPYLSNKFYNWVRRNDDSSWTDVELRDPATGAVFDLASTAKVPEGLPACSSVRVN